MKLPLTNPRIQGFVSRSTFGNRAFTSVANLVSPREYEVKFNNSSWNGTRHYVDITYSSLSPTWPGGGIPANFVHYIQLKNALRPWKNSAGFTYGYEAGDAFDVAKVTFPLYYTQTYEDNEGFVMYTYYNNHTCRLEYDFSNSTFFRMLIHVSVSSYKIKKGTNVREPHTVNPTGHFILLNPYFPENLSLNTGFYSAHSTDGNAQKLRHIFRFDSPGTPPPQ